MLKTPISILQEFATSKNLPFPIYKISGSGQPHDPTFSCEVNLDGKCTSATGSTKKVAKQNAAAKLLEVFDISLQNEERAPTICIMPSPSRKDDCYANYVGKLNEFSSGNRYLQPVYTASEHMINASFCMECSFLDFKTQGFGSTRKAAKQESAKNMLQLIKDKDLKGMGQHCTDHKTTLKLGLDQLDTALSKYVTIMKNLKISDSNGSDTALIGSGLLPPSMPGVFTKWEEMQMYFQRQGLSVNVSVFQAKPLILSLKINEYTFLDIGMSGNEIRAKFLFTVSSMVQRGHDFHKSAFQSVLR